MKNKLLYQVGISRHFHIWCTDTHTSSLLASNRPKMHMHTRTPKEGCIELVMPYGSTKPVILNS